MNTRMNTRKNTGKDNNVKKPPAPRRAASARKPGRRTSPMTTNQAKPKSNVAIKIGDVVMVNGATHTVQHDRNGLFINCSYGRHYLRDHGCRVGAGLVAYPVGAQGARHAR